MRTKLKKKQFNSQIKNIAEFVKISFFELNVSHLPVLTKYGIENAASHKLEFVIRTQICSRNDKRRFMNERTFILILLLAT